MPDFRALFAPDEKPEGPDFKALFAPDERSWLDVAGSAVWNAPRSAFNYASNTLNAINPMTAPQVGSNLAKAVEEQGVGGVGAAIIDPYTSMDKFKNTLAEDPFRIMGDAAAVAAPVGMLPGKLGRAASAVSRAVDPAMLPVHATKGATQLWGAATGTGASAIETAARAGAQGGAQGRSFLGHYTGASPIEEPVTDMRAAVAGLKNDRTQQYKQGMANLSQNRQVLNFTPIDNAVLRMNSVKTFKGQNLSASTDAVRQQIGQIVADWKQLNPADFHTPEGLDALKRKIYEEFPWDKASPAERKVIGEVTNAIKGVVTKQAPEYAKIMEDYSRAENAIDEITRALSAGERASVDTALRKLQSVFRNNVNTNYGYRIKLAELIAQKAPGLQEALAGQALSAGIPRGGAGWLSAGGFMSIIPLIQSGRYGTAAAVIGSMISSSPKVAGAAAYGAGALARPAYKAKKALERVGVSPRGVVAAAYQAGKTERETNPMSFAEKTLSPKVMTYIKSAPNTRGHLSKWVQAVKRGKGAEEAAINLADAIAQEVGRPDLADRIAQELSGN